MKLPRLLKLPPNRQGIAIDVLVIVINLFLLPFFSELIQGLFRDSFGNNGPAFKTLGLLMLIVLAGRIGGLYLKRFPLQARMRSSQASFPVYFMVFNAPIMILTAVMGAVVLQYLAADIGLLETRYDGSPKESGTVSAIVIFSVLILTGLEVYLLYRLGKSLSGDEVQKASGGSWLFGIKGELLADLGLFGYMMVWQVFYYFVADLFLTPPTGTSQGLDMQIFTVIFLLLCFMLFYVSPRAVFLTEDRKYFSTWGFIAVVFLTSLLPHSLESW